MNFCLDDVCAYAVLTLAFTVGCQPNVYRANVDPEDAAAKALEMYDKDGSGSLSETELAVCPGLLAMIDRYDTTGDKEVSHDEIRARLETLYLERVGLTTMRCQVTLDRRPLAGARVRYVPEPFLGQGVKAAEGVTDRAGYATIAIPEKELPEDLRGIAGLHLGLYRVEITHPSRALADKYHRRTVLGYEVRRGDSETARFELRSR